MAAFYKNTVEGFVNDSVNSIIGALTSQSSKAGFYQLKHAQTASWIEEFQQLQFALNGALQERSSFKSWGILLEYPIARREKRIDIVIIANNVIIVIEFKAGKTEYSNADKDQLLDYCLDLHDFHFESREKVIIPILWATNAKQIVNPLLETTDSVKNILFVNSNTLGEYLVKALNKWGNANQILNFDTWDKSNYVPTPTIIEAAKTLYGGQSVAEITNNHAGNKNLTETSDAVINAIKKAKANNQKIICFITGVPGAGKTLAGLNIAHDKDFQTQDSSLVTFLSGNAPLIKVLKKALSNDAYIRLKKIDNKTVKRDSNKVESFIENAHSFIDLYFTDDTKTPNNKIVIFDEAQRAWDAAQSNKKFKRDFSEPELLFEIMNRHSDWAAIVALVGGGQEINTGEAGLPEWGRILENKFSDWLVYISPELKIGDHSTGDLTLFKENPKNVRIEENSNLHLSVSLRSYKAEKLSQWVSFVLSNNPVEAKIIFDSHLIDYKIEITRDLTKAKDWLKNKCKGSRRMGLVASSGARRLRPYGLDVRSELEVEEWFLSPKEDVRSSYYLEIPATEFGIQGLELDWIGVCWDADLRRNEHNWLFKEFRGTKWTNISSFEKRNFWLNKYRVLLTRAREGMIIFIPPGSNEDPTRDPSFYDPIAEYLKSCGLKEV